MMTETALPTIGLSIADAAKACGMSKSSMTRELAAGTGPRRKHIRGTLYVVMIDDLRAWLAGKPDG